MTLKPLNWGFASTNNPARPTTMITPVFRDGLVWWVPAKFAQFYDLFICTSDEGRPFCAIRFEKV